MAKRYNMHYWSGENSHCLREAEHQHPWSVNVCCGIIGDQLIGLYFIDGDLNGDKCNVLKNKLLTLLKNPNLQVRQNMWFQYGG